LSAIARDPRFELVATVSRKGRIEGVSSFPTLAALLRDGPRVDAAAICTPPQVRGEIALSAVEAGLHVMLEKPPAATLGALETVRAAAVARGVTLFAAWHSRHAPMVEAAKQCLQGRVVVGGSVTWREDVRAWHPGQSWLWHPGGLGVFDPGVNAFSILTRIAPAPVVVEAAQFEVPRNCQAPIAARLAMRIGRAPISVDLDFRQTGVQTWDIELATAEGGSLKLRMGGTRIVLDGGAERAGPEAEYAELYDRFARLIASGESDVDHTPMQLVADAFLIARTESVDPFEP
jgi:D-galactose 1-dehydrogenase